MPPDSDRAEFEWPERDLRPDEEDPWPDEPWPRAPDEPWPRAPEATGPGPAADPYPSAASNAGADSDIVLDSRLAGDPQPAALPHQPADAAEHPADAAVRPAVERAQPAVEADDPADDPDQPADDGPAEWPELDGAPVTTSWAQGEEWDPRVDRRRPTTAEQAVPWLIGTILFLTGIVIVLLVLIFTGETELSAGVNSSPSVMPNPTSTPHRAVNPTTEPEPSRTPSPSPTPLPAAQASPTPEAPTTPTPAPQSAFGPLEVVYLARTSVEGPAWIYRNDFSQPAEAETLARADQGVQRFVWAPDGTVGAALIAGRLVAITPGSQARSLGDDVAAATFGPDSTALYAVRITEAGADDEAEVMSVDFATGEATSLAILSYPRPEVASRTPLQEAQFDDDGGGVRIYSMHDGNVVLSITGASIFEIEPESGDWQEIDELPHLWSPNGRRWAETTHAAGTTTLTVHRMAGEVLATTSVSGLVSHVRWSPDSSHLLFTLGRASPGGGVWQDLFVWDIEGSPEPTPLTNNGASFSGEWRGAPLLWQR